MSELKPIYSTIDARDKLLSAALSAFAELGFHGATIRDISNRAGVSPGLIAHHFGDKDRLWAVICERVASDFDEYINPVVEIEGVFEATIPTLLKSYLGYWRDHPLALRLQLWRVLGAPESERRARVQRLNRRIVPVFVEAQQAGFIRKDIPAGQAMITAGAIIQYRIHSEIEMQDALSVTGDAIGNDTIFLDYVYSIISSQSEGHSPASRGAATLGSLT